MTWILRYLIDHAGVIPQDNIDSIEEIQLSLVQADDGEEHIHKFGSLVDVYTATWIQKLLADHVDHPPDQWIPLLCRSLALSPTLPFYCHHQSREEHPVYLALIQIESLDLPSGYYTLKTLSFLSTILLWRQPAIRIRWCKQKGCYTSDLADFPISFLH